LTLFHSALDGGNRSKGISTAAHKALSLQEEKKGNGKSGRGRFAKAARCPEEVIPLVEGEFKDFSGIAYWVL
jgi:hypothetical protein